MTDFERWGTGVTADAEKTGQIAHTSNTSARNEQDPDAQHEYGNEKTSEPSRGQTISWAADLKPPTANKTFRVPPPQQRDKGAPLQEVDEAGSDYDDADKISVANASGSDGTRRRRGPKLSPKLSSAKTSMSIERVASSLFVLGDTQSRSRSQSRERGDGNIPEGSTQTKSSATVDREPSLRHLSKEELGGIEYRSLWLLLKIIVGTSSDVTNAARFEADFSSLLLWLALVRRSLSGPLDPSR